MQRPDRLSMSQTAKTFSGEKSNKDDAIQSTASENDEKFTDQSVVPVLIDKLEKARIEVLQNSNGPPLTFIRDPHLRLRRTLTPRSHITGIKKYSEAQFVIHPTTGKRQTISFETTLKNDSTKYEFLMDVYSWGASEEKAQIRMVALHGISPTASRERWHALGQRIQQDPVLSKVVRFVALDWHSIDRSDAYQQEFLTLLPKHIFDVPTQGQQEEEILQMFSKESRDGGKQLFDHCRENCNRGLNEAANVLKAVITKGLRWGPATNKQFIPCVKSWSGGVGVEMLFHAAHDEDQTFKQFIAGAVIMHPACFTKTAEEIKDAMANIPAIMVWAKDDHLVPYQLSERYLVHDDVKLVAYETGRHGSFDGSDPDEPNFDDDIIAWIQHKFL